MSIPLNMSSLVLPSARSSSSPAIVEPSSTIILARSTSYWWGRHVDPAEFQTWHVRNRNLVDWSACHSPYRVKDFVVITGQETDCDSSFPCAGCPPYTVEVHCGVLRHVVIDDMADFWNIKSARCNIRGY